MNTRKQALTAGALAAVAASVAIPALTGVQASTARSAHVAHARPGASQADQLRASERKRLHALVDADTATARRLMAADFQAISPAGATLARRDIFAGSNPASSVFDPIWREPGQRGVRSMGNLGWREGRRLDLGVPLPLRRSGGAGHLAGPPLLDLCSASSARNRPGRVRRETSVNRYRSAASGSRLLRSAQSETPVLANQMLAE